MPGPVGTAPRHAVAVSPPPATEAPAPARPRPRRRYRPSAVAWAAFFLAPTTLGLGFFYMWPVVQTVYFSFTKWGPFGGHQWTGLDNYRAIVRDETVLSALRNTVYFTLLGLAGIPISLVLAALLARKGRRGVTAYRALLFLPVVTMPAAVAIVWRWLYNGDYGLVNELLSHVGAHRTYWVSDPNTALVAVALVGIWTTVGYNMVILMAGMEAIPRHYYEAAEMDGATGVRQFFAITVPLISPSLFFVTVLSIIGSLQTFDLVYVMIGRTNPALPQTRTVVYLFYQKAFIENDRGYAAALAFLLLLLIVIVTAAQFRLQKRWVHYE